MNHLPTEQMPVEFIDAGLAWLLVVLIFAFIMCVIEYRRKRATGPSEEIEEGPKQ